VSSGLMTVRYYILDSIGILYTTIGVGIPINALLKDTFVIFFYQLYIIPNTI